jgi:hypothetical protein
MRKRDYMVVNTLGKKHTEESMPFKNEFAIYRLRMGKVLSSRNGILKCTLKKNQLNSRIQYMSFQ